MYYQGQQQGEWTEDGVYIPNPERLYTLEEYWKIVAESPRRKYEYINGHVRLMAGASLPHARIEANIVTTLSNAMEQSDCSVYSSSANVYLEEGPRVYLPDVTISCDSLEQMYSGVLNMPTVVVEVLSPGTEKVDREEKLSAYQAHPSIQEILLVSSRRRCVEHYHRIVSAGHDDLWELHTCTRDEDVVDLGSIGVRFSLREVYRRVYLELEEEEPEEPEEVAE